MNTSTKRSVNILGIETSCDETAAAVIKASGGFNKPKFKILSNIISSQVNLHRKYDGIVPEIASRAHVERIIPVIEEAFKEAWLPQNFLNLEEAKPLDITQPLRSIDTIAVTVGPGLIGSLLVGVNAAKTLSYVFKKPLMAVNHLEGHIYANWLSPIRESKKIEFPIVCLIVSGGHTLLVLMKDHLKYKILGETKDDAAGECFDKVARILGLGYPGGPAIAVAAKRVTNNHRPLAISLPRPMIDSEDFDFSFSGLKTAVLYKTKSLKRKTKNKKYIYTTAKEFQEAVADILITKTIKAAKKYKAKTIMLGGGVAANDELRKQFKLKIVNCKLKIKFLVPPKDLCTDNAAMIAAAGYLHYLKKDFTHWSKINTQANLLLK